MKNFPAINLGERSRLVLSPKMISVLSLSALLTAVGLLSAGCGGSKANVRQEQANAAQPVAVDITTATAIVRELPQYFEATGSLAGDEQTDVAPSVAGKVVAIGVDMGSYVKRGQMIVRLDDVDAKLRVQQQQAQVEQMKASLRQAEEKVGVRPGRREGGCSCFVHGALSLAG